MAIYELKVTKIDKWEEIYYLIPEGNKLNAYYLNPNKGIEKIMDIEKHWNLSSGGKVNLRTLVEEEIKNVLEKIHKK